MPRESIAMTGPELHTFLGGQEWMVLATLDADGVPAGELVATALLGGRLYFAVPHGGRAAEHLARDPRACCAADVFPSYYEIRGAVVHGSAEVVEAPPGTHAVARAAARGATVYSLPLDDVSSFDFAKIRNKY